MVFIALISLVSQGALAATSAQHLSKAADHLERFCSDLHDREVISYYEELRCKEVQNSLEAASVELSKELSSIRNEIHSLKKK